MKTYIAHSQRLDNGETQEQTVAEHCRNTANFAEECLKSAGLSQAGYLAGLMHDAGKCKEEFQLYIKAVSYTHLRKSFVNAMQKT